MTDPQPPSRDPGPALEKMFQFLLWLIPTLEKFPRSQKFLLADRVAPTEIMDHR